MRPILWAATAAVLLACAPASDSGVTAARADGADGTPGGADGADGADGTTDGADGTTNLNGTPPESPIPLPSFAATNRDGSARSRDDLLGHPTVMWFYPLAASAG